MQLFKPVIDISHRPYCGPTAISALTGVPISHIEKMLGRGRRGWRDRRGHKLPIRGTYTWEVVRVLKRLGCRVAEWKQLESTLSRFCEDTVHVGAAFLVEVTGHFVVAHRGAVCDGTTPAGPVPAAEHRSAQRRVRQAWRVSAPPTPTFTIDDPIKASHPPKPKRDIKVVRAEKLAEQIKRWEAKERRAKNALKRLRPRLARYARTGVVHTSA